MMMSTNACRHECMIDQGITPISEFHFYIRDVDSPTEYLMISQYAVLTFQCVLQYEIMLIMLICSICHCSRHWRIALSVAVDLLSVSAGLWRLAAPTIILRICAWPLAPLVSCCFCGIRITGSLLQLWHLFLNGCPQCGMRHINKRVTNLSTYS